MSSTGATGTVSHAHRGWNETNPGTMSNGGPNSYESLASIDANQQAAFSILRATLPLQYSSTPAGGGSQMLLTSLDPNRRSNPRLTPLQATPVTSLRYDSLAARAPPAVPVYGAQYYTLSSGYQGV